MKDKRGYVHHANVKDDGYDAHWGPYRKAIGSILHSKSFDLCRGSLVLVNILLMVVETDEEAENHNVPRWLSSINFFLILCYFLELIVRLCVYRLQYFHAWANWVDMIIIGVDVILEMAFLIVADSEGIPHLVILRTFRLLRLGRTHRALVNFPELNILFLGMRGALRAMMWGLILLAIVTLSFGILAVQIIHPINLKVAEAGTHDGCERCPRAFASVAAASLTFTQQIIAGDSWGAVTIPIIEHTPATAIFFVTVLSVLGMVLLNLILAVVIDSANQARQESDHQIAEAMEAKYLKATNKLLEFCKELDKDGSGSLSLPELICGYEDNVEFLDTMTVLDISEKDMNTVFSIMDEDKSGEVRYDEFVNELYKMKCEDSHTMITFIKFYVQEIQREMRQELGNTNSLLTKFDASLQQVHQVVHQSNSIVVPEVTFEEPLRRGLGGEDSKATSIDSAWLKQSHEELNTLMRNLVTEIQQTVMLGSLDKHMLLTTSSQTQSQLVTRTKAAESPFVATQFPDPGATLALEQQGTPQMIPAVTPHAVPTSLRCCAFAPLQPQRMDLA